MLHTRKLCAVLQTKSLAVTVVIHHFLKGHLKAVLGRQSADIFLIFEPEKKRKEKKKNTRKDKQTKNI